MSRVFKPLDDFQPADLPEPPRSFWQLAGPGAVLVGLSIGAGEIIIWPRAVAQHGAGMVWAAVVGVFLQMWVNFEIPSTAYHLLVTTPPARYAFGHHHDG